MEELTHPSSQIRVDLEEAGLGSAINKLHVCFSREFCFLTSVFL